MAKKKDLGTIYLKPDEAAAARGGFVSTTDPSVPEFYNEELSRTTAVNSGANLSKYSNTSSTASAQDYLNFGFAAANSNTPQVIRSGDTGRMTGLTIGGKSYLGLSQKDINAILEKQGPQATPEGAVEARDVAKKQRANEIINQLGNLTPQQIAELNAAAAGNVGEGFLPGNLNYGQAATAGAVKAAPGVVAGALGGATVGALGGPIGAVGGALIGGVGAFIGGALGNIKEQQTGLVKAQTLNIDKVSSNLNYVVSGVNMGMDVDQALILYNQQVAQAYQSWSELKLQTQGTAKAFDDGTKELEKFEIFFQPGGTLDVFNARMAQAVANPNPAKVAAEVLGDYQNSIYAQ